ncbi:MAG: hypothetical protein ABL993_10180, partial [Vicinamibacterales bacterium]
MRLPDHRTVSPPPPWRRVATVVLAGLACVASVLAIGRIAEIRVLGGNEAAARERVRADVRGSFDAMARGLRDIATLLARADALTAAADGDTAAARRLFDAAEAALGDDRQEDLAVTLYASDGRPIAWAGRPSELPADRLQGEEAWFVAQGALGLRLVYIVPVLSQPDQAGPGANRPARVGVVATERALGASAPTGGDQDDIFVVSSLMTPVSIELNFENGRTRPDASAFDVPTPAGDRLLTARVSSTDLVRTRERWRRAASSLATATGAMTLLLLCGPLLDWRDRARRVLPYLSATGLAGAAIVAGRLVLGLASPADWSNAAIFSGSAYASPLMPPLFTS